MEKKCLDVRVNVKPVFGFVTHKYYYEGPCRMAGGDALQPGFDDILNGKIAQGVMTGLGYAAPPDVCNIMEMNAVTSTDDWELKDSYIDELLREQEQADVFFVFSAFGADRMWREFGRKCKKPIIVVPNLWNPMKTAYYFNTGVEVYVPYNWEEVTDYLRAFRAKKAIAQANVLLVTRFSDSMCVAGADDSFVDLNEASRKFGTSFRPINFHELMEQMNPLPEGGNSTTPGRVTPNLTPEEIKELEDYADKLMAEADECEISKEYLVNSLKAWKAVRKNMDINDCSACAIPCPDVCSTRRLNESKFTFCLNNQLNNENGVPAACKHDIAAALTMMAEICLSKEAPYMANTLPIVDSKSGAQWITQIPEETRAEITDITNLYCVNMSPMMRKTGGIDGPVGKFAIRHFAYDQKFGAVFHHDFNEDIGKKITLARFSGDCKRLLIVKGEIVKGYGYEMHNCNGGYIFRVSDSRRLYKEQARTGLMLPMVFGDISRELELLAEVMGLEAVII
jgi:hypothetical protein